MSMKQGTPKFYQRQDRYGYLEWKPRWTVVGWITSVALVLIVICVAVWGGYAANRHMTAEDCRNWSIHNDRPAKFASYTYWDYGCITPDGHGHWIPTSNLYVTIPKVEGAS